MITFKQRGDFKRSYRLFDGLINRRYLRRLAMFGEKGVEALKEATPQRTGLTSESWTYAIEKTSNGHKIVWSNTNVVNGVQIAAIIQYGHGTGTGGYVEGIDYINPSMEPIFEQIISDAWKEVTSL